MKTYIYANSEILAQHNGPHSAAKYFYLHDRLGSIRQIINTSGLVQKYYTYEPFGQSIESGGTFADPFRFTGQFYDEEIGEYYLRARQYNPTIARFTARDPVFGRLEQPLTLHKYLYCQNDPLNAADPTGRATFHVMLSGMCSFGFSAMAQKGFVIDDHGNIGIIKTHNDPVLIRDEAPEGTFPEDMDEWGFGYGLPALSGGGAIGFTNADTIWDLRGPGISVGGSLGLPGLCVGVDYIRGVQQNGEYYHGFEVTPQLGTGLEAHGHRTYTTVRRLGDEDSRQLDMMEESLENAIFSSQSVGQSNMLLQIWGRL